MRLVFILLFLLLPMVANASSAVRVRAWSGPWAYQAYPLTQQVWVQHSASPTSTLDSTGSSDTMGNRHRRVQTWRRVARPSQPAIAVPDFSDNTYDHPDPNFGPAVIRNPPYSVQRIYRNVEVTSYNSERRQTDSTPWEIRRNFLVRFGDAACNFLPKGTLFRLPNAPPPFNAVVFRVEDETAAKYGHRIDLWLLHVQHAENWGVRRLDVEILGPPRGEAPR